MAYQVELGPAHTSEAAVAALPHAACRYVCCAAVMQQREHGMSAAWTCNVHTDANNQRAFPFKQAARNMHVAGPGCKSGKLRWEMPTT